MDWLSIFEVVLTSLVVPLAAWGINSLVNWLKTKTENAKLEKYITFAGDAVTMAVKETTQTYVDALKKEGNFGAEAQDIAFNKTFDKAISLLTAEAVEAIEMAYGDINEWLRCKIESTIADSK